MTTRTESRDDSAIAVGDVTETLDDVASDECFLKKLPFCSFLRRPWTRTDILLTVGLYLSVSGWGIFFGVLSSSLLDLEQLTHTTTSQVALMFTASMTGAIVGTFLGGWALSRVASSLYLAVVTALFGAAVITLPHSGSFGALMAISVVIGLLEGVIDCGLNVTALTIWGWDGSIIMQGFHCMFALGTFAGPWVAGPFLAPAIHVPTTHAGLNTSSITDSPIHVSPSMDSVNANMTVVYGESKAAMAFIITGVYMIMCSFLFVFTYVFTRSDSKSRGHPTGGSAKNKVTSCDVKVPEETRNKDKLWYWLPMTLLAFVRFAAYVGLEVTFSSFLITFAVKKLGWKKTTALTGTTVLYGSFAVSRMLSIGAAAILSPTAMMAADLALMGASFVCLAALVHVHPAVLFAAAAGVGLGEGSFYGASMSWLSRYMNVSPQIGAVFTAGSSVGVMTLPTLAGYLIDNLESNWFIYMCLLDVGLLAVVCLLAALLAWKRDAPLASSRAICLEEAGQGVVMKPLTEGRSN